MNYLSVCSVGSIRQYCDAVAKIPLLSADEEFQLALIKDTDLNAARKLVESCLRFVITIANQNTKYGIPIQDLIQEGNIGLMKAVKNFNPHSGVRLVYFAAHSIKGEIWAYIRSNLHLVKMTTTHALKKLFNNVKKENNNVAFTEDELEALSKEHGVTKHDLKEFEKRLTTKYTYIDDQYKDENDDGSVFEIPSEDNVESYVEQMELHSRLVETINKLPIKKHKEILTRMYINGEDNMSLLAREYGVSAQAVDQMRRSAIKQIGYCFEL